MKLLFSACAILLGAGCGDGGPATAAPAPAPVAREKSPGVLTVGSIQAPSLRESSGLVRASREGLFWSHSDGRRNALHGLLSNGNATAQFTIEAVLHDWEDLSTDFAGHLYLADTGNNDARREPVFVHEIKEPDTEDSKAPRLLRPTRSWTLRFPGKTFDAEALFIWKDHGHLVTKVSDNARAGLFRWPLAATGPVTLERLGELPVTSPVAGAAISPDGSVLALVAKNGAYAFPIGSDPARALSVKPHHTRLRQDGIEGCAFTGGGLLATCESGEILLFTDKAFKPGGGR